MYDPTLWFIAYAVIAMSLMGGLMFTLMGMYAICKGVCDLIKRWRSE